MISPSLNEPHEIALAWQQLGEHQTDRQSGDCRLCQLPGPCAVANEAVALLVARGVEVTADRQPEGERRRRRLAILATFRSRARRGPGR